jgi:diacylglycerol kinase (CTP)
MTDSGLPELVDHTRGPQPARRLAHAAWGCLIASAVATPSISRPAFLVAGASAFVALLLLDVVRLNRPGVNRAFFTTFRWLASPREERGLASSTWYTLGAIVVAAFFPRSAAVSAILVLALADPAASYIGRRWGRRPLLGGSVEGTLVFVGVAFLVTWPRHGAIVGLATGVLSAWVERRSGPVDDNLAIPVVAAATITLMESVGG